jgi:hypothetical protein
MVWIERVFACVPDPNTMASSTAKKAELNRERYAAAVRLSVTSGRRR